MQIIIIKKHFEIINKEKIKYNLKSQQHLVFNLRNDKDHKSMEKIYMNLI